jgi:conjugative relaxase-like TrwC/TraI family protein
VLTVAKIAGSGAAAYGQYLEGRTVAVEAGDYYLAADGERVEAPGRWMLGEQGAATLGVDAGRPVAAEQFQMLMAVQNPATGGRLRAGGAGGSSVAAIDATFSAPKSVSAVWALASPELRAEIELAQERAVDSALAHAVEFVPMVRRRVDRETVLRETPAELIATSWRHTTARAVAGRAPDPQLHSHVVLHGAVRQGDGKVVAIESRAWLVHQREVGAAYRAQLASELGRLGFGIEVGTGRGGRYFELTGVPQGLLQEWSGRHRQVQQQIQRRLTERLAALQRQVDAGGAGADAAAARLVALERSGQLMPAEQRAVAMRTRSAKGSGGAELETAGDLDRAWYDAAQEHDFDARSVQALLHEPGHPIDVAEPALAREAAIERRILERLTEFAATFAAREARAVALEVTAGGLSPAAGLIALERLRDRREILELADGRETTRSHRGTERAAISAANGLADATAEPIAEELVDDEISELRSELALGGMRLAVEQEQAIRVGCSDQRLTVVVGQAGTGKSTALTAVARAHQEAGQKIIVTSTGAQAAERLAAEFSAEGVSGVAGCSTAALQAAVRRGTVTLSPGVTVIHDEAALASTREQAWLLQAVAETGARLIEVGDPRQSQAVGAGGLWPAIEAAAAEHEGLVELSRIVRAKDAADRRDQARWRAGIHDQALAGYATRGRVHVADTQRQAEDHALEAAHADRQAGKTALVVVQTSNDALDGLNARAQALRIQDGLLTGEQQIALAGRPYGLRAGDEIVLRAASVHPGLGAVRNGTRGTVLDVADDDEHATLRLADGREAVWERAQLDAASARLSYVSHTFPAQGQTVDRAHVIAGEHADQNGTYVALTRAREQTHLYASVERLSPGDEPADGVLSDRQALVEALAGQLGRSEVELPSIAVALAHEQRVTRELDRETGPVDDADDVAEPPQGRSERDELDERRQERDRLRAVVDSYPAEAAREIDRLWQAGVQERQAADGDAQRAAHWQGVYDDLGVLRRRGAEGRQIHDRAEQFTARAEQQQQHADQLAAQARTLAESPAGPRAWEHAHPAIREQLFEAETALAAAVDRRVVWERSGPAAGGSESPDSGTAHQQLAWLSAERDRLKAQLRGYPRQHARDAEHADQQAKLASRSAQAARERAQQVGQEREELGRLARRGRRGSDALERQHGFQEQAERHDQRAETERQTAREARERPGGPAEWDRAHPGVRDRLSIYEHAHDIASEQQARRLLASDPTIAVRVLGPRPQTPEQRTIWDRGAEAISSYRAAHHITDQDTVLGAEPNSGAPNGFQQHADWKHAAELALQARRELGVDSSRERGSVAEQARQVPELTPPPPELDRGLDRDRGFGY